MNQLSRLIRGAWIEITDNIDAIKKATSLFGAEPFFLCVTWLIFFTDKFRNDSSTFIADICIVSFGVKKIFMSVCNIFIKILYNDPNKNFICFVLMSVSDFNEYTISKQRLTEINDGNFCNQWFQCNVDIVNRRRHEYPLRTSGSDIVIKIDEERIV